MEFKDLFRLTYRKALHAARENDKEGTIAGLRELCRIFVNQYESKNGDPIVVKAKLSYWRDVFDTYLTLVERYGLQERRVQKFFGLLDDDDIPSFGDLLNGKGDVALPSIPPSGSQPDISGLVPPAHRESTPSTDPVLPVLPEEPVLPVLSETPNVPAGTEEPIVPVVTEESNVPAGAEELNNPAAEDGNGEGAEAGSEEAGEDVEESGEKTIPSYDPDTLEGFIGQQHIVKPLLKEIAIAKAQGRQYLDNILLFGNPGLGKSTLMRLIAKALGVRFEWMDCSQYRNSQQSLKALQNFLMKVARENEPVVIAFDEIHMLTDELQSSLLTLLNDRIYVSPPDVNGVVRRIPIDNFTFIAATTDDDKVLNTIKDRCLRLKFQMVDYTPEELKRIYKNKVAAIGLTITEEAIDACIPRSRGSIRYVNAFVNGLDRALYDDNGKRFSTSIDLDIVKGYFEERGIDEIGLEKKDLEILHVIEADPSGAIGVEALSARVGLDPKKYMSEYEPYLLKIQFITISGRGRGLTEAAIRYLKGKKEDD